MTLHPESPSAEPPASDNNHLDSNQVDYYQLDSQRTDSKPPATKLPDTNPSFGRRETLLGALRCLQALHPGPCQIVETGTLRDEREGAAQSDGWSTLAWGAQAARCQGRVWTVDVDAAALATCRRLTEAYAFFTEYVCRDSLTFLREWNRAQNGPIHLLYLDSLDYGANYDERERSEAHQLAEAQAALPHLHEVCLVLLDDTSLAPRARQWQKEQESERGKWEGKKWEGKGTQSIPFLEEQGFEVVWEPYEHWSHGGQVLLVRGAPVEQLQEILCAPEVQYVPEVGDAAEWDGAVRAKGEGDKATPTCPPSRQRHWQPRPLQEVPYQLARLAASSHLTHYLATVLRYCPPGARTLEVESGSGLDSAGLAGAGLDSTGLGRGHFAGLGAIWLSLRGVQAAGCDNVPMLMEQARYANSVLGGAAHFEAVELFDLYDHYSDNHDSDENGTADDNPPDNPLGNPAGYSVDNSKGHSGQARFHVIHHHGLLQQFALPWMRALLAQQVALAEWVVFSVPSVYYDEGTSESGSHKSDSEAEAAGRLLPLEEWRRVLKPFEVEELRYYGPATEILLPSARTAPEEPEKAEVGKRSHILCVLRGHVLCGGVLPEQTANQETVNQETANRETANQEMAGHPAQRHQSQRHKSHNLKSHNLKSHNLKSLMRVRPEPYTDGISAIVHTRNEARHIAECLASLQDWTDEIIVCDMESTDDTVEIARRFTDSIIAHPQLANFDRARNVSALRARFRWVFYLDADERVPPALGQALRSLVMGRTPPFAGLLPPFRHCFAGQWLQSLYPGYTAPRLFKNGRFLFNARLHAGCEVDGPLACFPADNPELSLLHFSYDSVAHYLEKFNRYTDGEAANMERDGKAFSWQAAIGHWAHDLSSYYDAGQTRRDGVHGLLYAFLGGFYRFTQHAKLYEKRYHSGQLQPLETQVPQSVEEMLEYALHVLRAGRGEGVSRASVAGVVTPVPEANVPEARLSVSGVPVSDMPVSDVPDSVESVEGPLPAVQPSPRRALPAPTEIRLAAVGASTTNPITQTPANTTATEAPAAAELTTGTPATNIPAPEQQAMSKQQAIMTPVTTPARLVWSGPLWDPSGYGEESRQFALACDAVGLPVAAQALPWSFDAVALEEETREVLEALTQREAVPGFTQVLQTFPPLFARHPQAGFCIGRTMFETDRLPPEWVVACNRMDAIWVPSEWNRATFERAGVAKDKLAVIPGCLEEKAYQESPAALWQSLPAKERQLLDGLGFGGLVDAADTIEKSGHERVHKSGDKSSEKSGPLTFLTVFDWTLHKGWDVLLRAFVEEFAQESKGHKEVRLVLKVWSTMGYRAGDMEQQAAAYLQAALGHDLSSDERIVFLHQKLSSAGMRALYAACDAFVLPSRGEGWGRPYMEAMAWGKPTIATNWSGNTAFMTQGNSYLLDYRLAAVPERGYLEIPTYQGHRWAEPDGGHLRQVLRRVYEEREEAARIGARGRQEVLQRFNHGAVGRLIAGELQRLIDKEKHNAHARTVSPTAIPSIAIPPTSLSVRWEGDFFQWHSLAHVNRELCGALLNGALVSSALVNSALVAAEAGPAPEESPEPALELSLVTDEPQGFPLEVDPRWHELAKRTFAPLSAPAHVHVRHAFPPRFQAPPEGHLVLMQPWEYGYLPVQWLEPLHNGVSEVWC